MSAATLSIVQRNAAELERCLTLADFAEHQAGLDRVADGLRRMAQLHADEAWRAVAIAQRQQASA